MHKNATKCKKTQSKWCINKHGASKLIDTFEMYQPSCPLMGANNPHLGFMTARAVTMAAGAPGTIRDMEMPLGFDPCPLPDTPLARKPLLVGLFQAATVACHQMQAIAPSIVAAKVPPSPTLGGTSM
jgi:hypothetical protein